MRIGIDARPAESTLTGVGLCVANLVRYLIGQGHECVLLGTHAPAVAVTADLGLQTAVIPCSSRFRWEQILLPKALRQVVPQLYHATWNYGVPLLCPCPAVLTIHDVIPLAMPNYFSSWKGRVLARLKYWTLVMASAWRAKIIITDSESSKRDITRWLRIPAHKVRVVYNGLDRSYRPVQDQGRIRQVAAHYGVSGEYLIYVGGLDRRKNIDGLLKAFKIVRAQADSTLQLTIVGERNFLYPELAYLAHSLEIESWVTFTGYVPTDDMPALMSGAKMLIYPSFYEGFGFPSLEGMACGVPVITSNVSSLPEIAGDAALLIDPYNVEQITAAMMRLLNDNDLREELIQRGLERVRAFSWEKMGAETLAVYREVLADS